MPIRVNLLFIHELIETVKFILNYLNLNSGLKIVTTLLGGGTVNDGIDKVDNGGGSPMQVKIIKLEVFQNKLCKKGCSTNFRVS